MITDKAAAQVAKKRVIVVEIRTALGLSLLSTNYTNLHELWGQLPLALFFHR